MSANVLLFPRSHPVSAFHVAARLEAEAQNIPLKSFTRQELIQLATLTERPLQVGLMTGCRHYEHESGVLMQGFSEINPAEVVFSLYKSVPETGAIRYCGFVPLFDSKVQFDTPNRLEAFAKLQSGLAQACYEYVILHDVPSYPGLRSELT